MKVGGVLYLEQERDGGKAREVMKAQKCPMEVPHILQGYTPLRRIWAFPGAHSTEKRMYGLLITASRHLQTPGVKPASVTARQPQAMHGCYKLVKMK